MTWTTEAPRVMGRVTAAVERLRAIVGDWLYSPPREPRVARPSHARLLRRARFLGTPAPDLVIVTPYVVVQNNVFNASPIATAVVCALTSNLKRAAAPGNVLLRPGEANLPKQSVVNVSQLFTVLQNRQLFPALDDLPDGPPERTPRKGNRRRTRMDADGNQVLSALISVHLRFPNFGCGFAALWTSRVQAQESALCRSNACAPFWTVSPWSWNPGNPTDPPACPGLTG